jgi:hypothetical protein
MNIFLLGHWVFQYFIAKNFHTDELSICFMPQESTLADFFNSSTSPQQVTYELLEVLDEVLTGQHFFSIKPVFSNSIEQFEMMIESQPLHHRQISVFLRERFQEHMKKNRA